MLTVKPSLLPVSKTASATQKHLSLLLVEKLETCGNEFLIYD